MVCYNKEKFTTYKILFEQTINKDSNDQPLFILDNYTNLKSLACDISEKSVITLNITETKENEENIPNESSKYEKYHIYFRNSGSSGLSGRSFAAIIISVVAASIIFIWSNFYLKGRTTNVFLLCWIKLMQPLTQLNFKYKI